MNKYINLQVNDKYRAKVKNFKSLLVKYTKDKQRLSSLIDNLKTYQDNLPKNDRGEVNWMPYIILLILVFMGIIIAKRRI